LARERIIVKEAINSSRKVLREILKNVNISFQYNQKSMSVSEIVSSCNLLSLVIKFLHGVPRVNDLVNEVALRLIKLQESLIDKVSKESYDREFDLYFHTVYPLSRFIEALSNVQLENKLVVLDKYLDDLLGFLSSLDSIIDENQKLVPPVQGLLRAHKISDKMKRRIIEETLNNILSYAIELDPNLTEIYTQDIYYSIKLYRKEYIQDYELRPLYNNLNSKIFRKVLKGLEYLTALKIDPPQSAMEYVMMIMPKFFNEVFRIGDPNNHVVYYSSIAESLRNILTSYNNKTFAHAVMNHLIEDTGWIAKNTIDMIDVIRTIIGTNLLVLARGAIRR